MKKHLLAIAVTALGCWQACLLRRTTRWPKSRPPVAYPGVRESSGLS